MFEQEFKEDRNWAIIIGNTWTHHVLKNGDPEHLLPILKDIQQQSMEQGGGERIKVAHYLDEFLSKEFPEKSDDIMEVYTHDWNYCLDPNGDIKYSKCNEANYITIEFNTFKNNSQRN